MCACVCVCVRVCAGEEESGGEEDSGGHVLWVFVCARAHARAWEEEDMCHGIRPLSSQSSF